MFIKFPSIQRGGDGLHIPLFSVYCVITVADKVVLDSREIRLYEFSKHDKETNAKEEPVTRWVLPLRPKAQQNLGFDSSKMTPTTLRTNCGLKASFSGPGIPSGGVEEESWHSACKVTGKLECRHNCWPPTVGQTWR